MANSAIVGTLRAILTLDTAEYESNAKRVSQSAKEWTKDFQTVGKQATQLGSTLTKALTLPLVGLAVGAAKLSVDFESAFAGVRKTVDATEPEFQAMAQAFRNLAKEIPISVNELARLGEAAGALGIPKDKVVEFSKVMALLGVTTNLTAEQASDAIARIQNIFGAAGKDTDRFASTLVALGNAGASTETEIVEMSQRIAGAGHTIGLTEAQVLGFASTLASVGINAEAGGSAISRIFLKMNDAVMGGGDALTEFARVAGVSSAQFKEAFEKDASQATVMFVSGLSRLKGEGENTNATMEGMIGKNIILKDTLNRLTGAGSLLSDQLKISNTAWQDNTALTNEANKRFETTEAQLTLLWNRFQDVGITLGNALLPAIKTLVSFVGGLIPVLEGAVKLFTSLPQPVQLAALGMAALAAAAGPMIYFFGQMALSSAAVTAAFTANGLATRFLFADLGLLVTGLRSATVAALATTTEFGLMGAASIAVGNSVKALWAVMAAHPLVALAAAIGLVVVGLVKLYNTSQDQKQTELINGIKAETIARAEQAGVILKSADAKARYLEAVDALQKIEVIQQARFGGTIELQKQALQNELELGRITQDTFNVRMAALAGEQQANDVRKNRVTITDVAAQAEKNFKSEIAATGYTLAELQKLLKDDPKTFELFAKQAGLSTETVGRLKESLKQSKTEITALAKEQRAATKDAAEFQRGLETQNAALKALGITTKQDVNREMDELRQLFIRAQDEGVPFKNIVTAIIPKLEDLAKRAKASGLEVDGLTDALHELTGLPPLLPAALFGSAQQGIAKLTSGFKSVTAEQMNARSDSELLAAAYGTLGVKTQAELHAIAEAARVAYRRVLESGTATAAQLIEAREKVTQAEIDAGERTVSIWQGLIKPAVENALTGVSQAVSTNLVDMIGHWSHHASQLKEMWQGIRDAFLNVLDQMLSQFINGFLKGMLDAIGASKLGQALSNALLGGLTGSGGLAGLLGGGGAAGTVSAVGGAAVPAIEGGAAAASGGTAAATGGGIGLGLGIAGAFAAPVLLYMLLGNHKPDEQLFADYQQSIAGTAGSFWNTPEGQQAIADFQAANPSGATTSSSEPKAYYDDNGDIVRVPGFEAGTNGRYLDFGTGTLAMLHGHEKITPEGAEVGAGAWGRGMTVIFEEDGRTKARYLWPYLEGEVRRLRLDTA